VIGRPELVADPRFADFTARFAHRDELEPILDDVLGARPVVEWIELLTAAGVPCAPINTVAQALREAHTIARGLIVETEHPRFGTVRSVNSPARVGPQPTTHRPAPTLGEHTDEILTTILGLADEQIAHLAASGAFGPQA
jgi:crotonobetainyl-CoA:carnitine CoA-transferase CaiB-like acyl-CoA transferase